MPWAELILPFWCDAVYFCISFSLDHHVGVSLLVVEVTYGVSMQRPREAP